MSSGLLLLGAGLAVLAAVGLLRFSTTYARLHAAGKASPVAFVVVVMAAIPEVGAAGAARLVVAAAAMFLTLPVGVHLLFRAVHRGDPGAPMATDDLAVAERRSPDQAEESR